MASHKISTRSARGFSLIEILVVMGIFTLVASFGLLVSFDSFRGYSFRDERDQLVSALQRARSQAMSNMCFGGSCTDGKAHGVHLTGGLGSTYIVFQGTTYTAGDTLNSVIAPKINSLTTTAADVVFAPLSGMVAGGPITITITDGGSHTSVITVEPEGRVWWTN